MGLEGEDVDCACGGKPCSKEHYGRVRAIRARCRHSPRRPHLQFPFLRQNGGEEGKEQPGLLRKHHQRKPNILTIHKQRPVRIPEPEMDPALTGASLTTTGNLPSTMTRCRQTETEISVPSFVTTTSPIPSTNGSISVTKKSNLGQCCKMVKRLRSSRMRRVKRQEYKKLREMVPALQEKNKVSKVVVIEEAIKYIDELHSALVQRFKSRGAPATFNGVYLNPEEVHGGNIRDLIRRLLANANPNSLPPSRIENVRTLPSFLQKVAKHKKGSKLE